MSAVLQSRQPKIPTRIGKANERKKTKERKKERERKMKKDAAVQLRAHFHVNQTSPHLDNFGLVWFSFVVLYWNGN